MFHLIFIFLMGCGNSGELSLNEVVSKSDTTSDWFELYNFGDSSILLSRWSVIDNIDEDIPWELPGVELAPGEFILIWASDGEGAEEGYHCPFKLSGDGETLYLLDSSNKVFDQVTFPDLARDQSYGRTPDGTGEWDYQPFPTPESGNE